MKKTLVVATLLLAVLFIFSSIPAFAQTEPRKQIVVYEDELTTLQLAKAKTEEKMQQYEQYSGIVAKMSAIADGSGKLLSNISTEVNKFADTKVGLFTVAMIFYSVMGTDLVQVFFGTLWFIIGVPVILWSYRQNCVQRKILKSKTGSGKDAKKEYTIINDEEDDYLMWNKWGHVLVFFCYIIAWGVITFA
jgi:hypothetical protein